MGEEPKPRRWFRPRYSLTALFVLITAFGCWLAVQVKWLRDRREAPKNLGIVVIAKGRSAPWSLRLLGEEGVSTLWVVERDDDPFERRAHVWSLFPEAEIAIVPAWRAKMNDVPRQQ